VTIRHVRLEFHESQPTAAKPVNRLDVDLPEDKWIMVELVCWVVLSS
jgi:hypothetical protein